MKYLVYVRPPTPFPTTDPTTSDPTTAAPTTAEPTTAEPTFAPGMSHTDLFGSHEVFLNEIIMKN